MTDKTRKAIETHDKAAKALIDAALAYPSQWDVSAEATLQRAALLYAHAVAALALDYAMGETL